MQILSELLESQTISSDNGQQAFVFKINNGKVSVWLRKLFEVSESWWARERKIHVRLTTNEQKSNLFERNEKLHKLPLICSCRFYFKLSRGVELAGILKAEIESARIRGKLFSSLGYVKNVSSFFNEPSVISTSLIQQRIYILLIMKYLQPLSDWLSLAS